MTAYYNEIDPYAAHWLRNLIAAGYLPAGDVDERSIEDVKPDEIARYAQCHFFAGVGGWPYALRLAGWPDDRPVWTGSCPCQPFSGAGKRGGAADKRHLWPAMHHLVSVCRPEVVFGEQVEAAIGHGWLDLVQADLEGEGYAVGACSLPACSVGAPHIRQRLWWVADALRSGRPARRTFAGVGQIAGGGGGMGDPLGQGLAQRFGDTGVSGDQGGAGQGKAFERAGIHAGAWGDIEWLPCIDGKQRPTQPGLRPLAHGVPSRVGQLRAYGNAIVPQVAAEFVKAFMADDPKNRIVSLDEFQERTRPYAAELALRML